MTSRLTAVTYDARDPSLLGRFWAAVLDREPVEDARGVLLPGTQTQVGLRFTASTAGRTTPDRLHLHLSSDVGASQHEVVARLLGLGARHVDVGQRPEEGHVVLADPEGNLLCVIGEGSRWLAGCGFFAEVTCDGTREVGLFWRDALGWPLVWDTDGETAVQAPAGGTKLAWGGPPVPPVVGRPRQRFELVTTDGLEAETERLVALGASVLSSSPASVALTDPDGVEFALLPG